MLSSIVLAWLAVIFTVLSMALYFVKRFGSPVLRKVFSRTHIAAGILLILTGVAHGILAGNMADSTLSDMMVAPVLFTWNWGTLCLIVAVLLAVSYIARKRLKKQWMGLHRALTVALVALVALHVSDVGVQLFDQVQIVSYAEAVTEDTAEQTAAAAQTDTVSQTYTVTDVDTAALVETANAQFSGATLTDGVYQGSATGYRSTITVSVTVSGGTVTDITVVSESDTASYFRRAETVIDTIIEEQSLEVDAVSGATYSSAGIVNAVSDALASAVDSGTLAVTEYTYTNNHSNHRR